MLIFTKIYIFQKLKKLAFNLTHVRIIGNYHCVNTPHEAFKRRSANKYLLFPCDYDERVVVFFSHQIQSEYYGGNQYVCIEGIALDHFSASTQTKTATTTQTLTGHAVFHSCFLMT